MFSATHDHAYPRKSTSKRAKTSHTIPLAIQRVLDANQQGLFTTKLSRNFFRVPIQWLAAYRLGPYADYSFVVCFRNLGLCSWH